MSDHSDGQKVTTERTTEDVGGKPESEINSRLQKGGALLSDMRQMVALWSEDAAGEDPMRLFARGIPKATIARVKDTYTRAFRPRFIQGSPPDAWRLAKVLEQEKADQQVIRPFYYWVTARSESLLYAFVTEVVYDRSRSQEREVRIDDAIAWLGRRLALAGKAWTPTVTKKVARGMMAALRDFGILEGAAKKRVASFSIAPEAFALIAFCLHDMGFTGRDLVLHTDWRLFLLNNIGVEQLLLECHQHGWLRFESAGNIYRTELPDMSFKEFAHVVLG